VTGHTTLILGGARSGKSTWAEHLASQSGHPVLFVATATAGDDEMAERIARHRAQRPPEWRTIEESSGLLDAVQTAARPGDAVLVDCLTLWVSNRIGDAIGSASYGKPSSPTPRGSRAPSGWRLGGEGQLRQDDARHPDSEPNLDDLPPELWRQLETSLATETEALVAAARERNLVLILISNEVGMGIVPATPLGRRYRDALGRVNQAAAATADSVVLMIAGLPVDLRKLTVAAGRRPTLPEHR
jgi:adenosylcobinamide kinase/adenosylcobinamide-phosphate guanylyltransferase